jgi:hypothetical protein
VFFSSSSTCKKQVDATKYGEKKMKKTNKESSRSKTHALTFLNKGAATLFGILSQSSLELEESQI